MGAPSCWPHARCPGLLPALPQRSRIIPEAGPEPRPFRRCRLTIVSVRHGRTAMANRSAMTRSATADRPGKLLRRQRSSHPPLGGEGRLRSNAKVRWPVPAQAGNLCEDRTPGATRRAKAGALTTLQFRSPSIRPRLPTPDPANSVAPKPSKIKMSPRDLFPGPTRNTPCRSRQRAPVCWGCVRMGVAGRSEGSRP